LEILGLIKNLKKERKKRKKKKKKIENKTIDDYVNEILER